MEDKKRGYGAYIALIVTFLIWGSNYVVNKFATSSLPGQVLAGCRNTVSLIPLWFLARREMPFPKIERSDRKYFLLVGFLGYFFMHDINTIGIALTNASTGGTINGLTPVAITLTAALLLREKLDPVKLLCLALAIIGTLVISSGGMSGSPLGIAILVFALFCWGVATVFIRKLSVKYPAIMVTFYSVAIGVCFHIPTIVITAAVGGGLEFTFPTVLSILYLGFVVTAVGHMLWAKSLSVFEATFCSMFYPLQSLTATVLGILFLGEEVSPRFFIGLVLITADVVIMCLHNRRLERAALAAREQEKTK